jgi:hypothetical protein
MTAMSDGSFSPMESHFGLEGVSIFLGDGNGGLVGGTIDSNHGLDSVIGVADVTATPLPAALPLFAGGLGALGLLGWRRKRNAAKLAA